MKRGLRMGLGIGLILAVVVGMGGALAGLMSIASAGPAARRGWPLTPVLVATIELDAGTSLTLDHFSTRDVPSIFVTANSVTPDGGSKLLNRPLLFSLHAGDPIRWTDVEPAFPMTVVLLATRDLLAGTKLTSADFEELRVSSKFVNDSWVRADDSAMVLGHSIAVPTLKGDPILWTHLPPKAAK